ncbi:MAG: hypothetical protein HDR26_02765, partial [Lachnospiraceae bacterium]|nr:hypothetical protein [Lachnospiraceae bacterium]
VALIVLILSLGLVFLTPYSLVATVLAVGFLIFNVVRANKIFPARMNAALEQLNACMLELADFKQYYSEEKEKKDILQSKVEYL